MKSNSMHTNPRFLRFHIFQTKSKTLSQINFLPTHFNGGVLEFVIVGIYIPKTEEIVEVVTRIS